MDKTFMLFVAVGLSFLYIVTNFVGDIQSSDEKYQNNDYKIEHKYDQYNSTDSIGRSVLNLLGADSKTQVEAWGASDLKGEFIELFPDFEAMKVFVDERIIGDELKKKINKKIADVENQFFAGTIDAEKAKYELGSLK